MDVPVPDLDEPLSEVPSSQTTPIPSIQCDRLQVTTSTGELPWSRPKCSSFVTPVNSLPQEWAADPFTDGPGDDEAYGASSTSHNPLTGQVDLQLHMHTLEVPH